MDLEQTLSNAGNLVKKHLPTSKELDDYFYPCLSEDELIVARAVLVETFTGRLSYDAICAQRRNERLNGLC